MAVTVPDLKSTGANIICDRKVRLIANVLRERKNVFMLYSVRLAQNTMCNLAFKSIPFACKRESHFSTIVRMVSSDTFSFLFTWTIRLFLSNTVFVPIYDHLKRRKMNAKAMIIGQMKFLSQC